MSSAPRPRPRWFALFRTTTFPEKIPTLLFDELRLQRRWVQILRTDYYSISRCFALDPFHDDIEGFPRFAQNLNKTGGEELENPSPSLPPPSPSLPPPSPSSLLLRFTARKQDVPPRSSQRSPNQRSLRSPNATDHHERQPTLRYHDEII